MAKTDLKRLASSAAMKKRRKAVADPTRMRILGLVSESGGLSAKELAQRLRMEANRLYYHLRILVDAGVITVAELRASGRNTERVYKEGYDGRYVWDAEDPGELASYMAAQLEVAKIEAEQLLFDQAERAKSGQAGPVVLWASPSFAATGKDAREFHTRVAELISEFEERAKTGSKRGLRQMRFTWVLTEQPSVTTASTAKSGPA